MIEYRIRVPTVTGIWIRNPDIFRRNAGPHGSEIKKTAHVKVQDPGSKYDTDPGCNMIWIHNPDIFRRSGQ